MEKPEQDVNYEQCPIDPVRFVQVILGTAEFTLTEQEWLKGQPMLNRIIRASSAACKEAEEKHPQRAKLLKQQFQMLSLGQDPDPSSPPRE